MSWTRAQQSSSSCAKQLWSRHALAACTLCEAAGQASCHAVGPNAHRRLEQACCN